MSDGDDIQPAATLPLPNAVAYIIAAVSVITTLLLPIALAGELTLIEAVEGYYVVSAALFGVLGALILHPRKGHVIGCAADPASSIKGTLPVSAQATGLGRYSPEVEAAVYFSALGAGTTISGQVPAEGPTGAVTAETALAGATR